MSDPGTMKPEPVGRPVGRSKASWAFDLLVMAFCWVSSLPFLFHDGSKPGAATLFALALVILPLALRRRWPVPVLVWVLVSGVCLRLWNPDAVDGFAALVSLYTVASLRPRRETFAIAGIIEVAVLVSVLRFAGHNWWIGLIFLTGLVVAAVGLGLYSATRRAYLFELQDRAERLEREKDQQVALAAAGERARMVREMHDIVAHHLTVMIALSEGAIAASAASPARGVEVMREVSATGRRALAETRRLLGVLRSDTSQDGLEPMPDLAELDELIDRIRAAGLPTTLEVRGAATALPAAVQLTVYRLVQEALTNTLKYAGDGAHAAVRLHHLPDELRVEVDDDGVGAAAPSSGGAGNGLIGMRERISAFGGDLHCGPGDLSGWRVSARLPLDRVDA